MFFESMVTNAIADQLRVFGASITYKATPSSSVAVIGVWEKETATADYNDDRRIVSTGILRVDPATITPAIGSQFVIDGVTYAVMELLRESPMYEMRLEAIDVTQRGAGHKRGR